LTAGKLADGIKQLLTDQANQEAQKIAKSIEDEGDGAKNAVSSFHRSLILRGQHSMRCSILEDRVAVWAMKNTHLRLSALAAELLVERKKISWKQLRLVRHNEWNDFEGPGEPLTGGATAIMGTVTSIAAGVGSVPFKLAKTSKRRARHEEKKKRKAQLLNPKGNSIETSAAATGKPSYGQRKECHQLPNENEERAEHGEADTSPSNQSSKENTNDSILNSHVPSKSEHKATSGPDLGKHTTEGEPMEQKKDASREQHDLDAIPDDDSEISDDPDGNAAEEMAQDVGMGFGFVNISLSPLLNY
jgi:hypothetical protein